MKKLLSLLLAFALLLSFCGCDTTQLEDAANRVSDEFASIENELNNLDQKLDTITDLPSDSNTQDTADRLDPDGTYSSKEDVALYIHTYGQLPNNFITKKEAQALGWEGGSLEDYAPGKCIGGDRFGNREGLLPKASGRTYTECDIDTLGASKRGAKRIVFSNDGLIYYTEDHYESFTLLYGEE